MEVDRAAGTVGLPTSTSNVGPVRGLTAWAMAVLVMAGAAGCSSGSKASSAAPTTTVTPTTASTTTTSSTTVTTPPTTAPPTTTVMTLTGAFQTPSHNIGCYVTDQGVRCDIRDRTWTPPPPPTSCPTTYVGYGQGLQLSSGAASIVCAGDTTLDPNGTVVPYGTSVQEGSVACDVESTGVTCTDSHTGHGFALSRDSYRIF